MILNLIWIQIKHGLISLKKPLNILILIFVVLGGLGYGFIFVKFFNEVGTGELETINPLTARKYGILGLMLITIIRMFIPSYKPLKTYFPSYYPLSSGQQYLTSILMDILHPYFLFQMLLLGTLSIGLEEGGLKTFIIIFSILFSTHFMRRMVQYVLDFKLKPKAYIMVVFTSLLLLFIGLFPDIYVDNIFISAPLVFLILVFTGWIEESNIYDSKKTINNFELNITNQNLKLIYKNKKVRGALLMLYVVKVIFVVLYYNEMKNVSGSEFTKVMVYLFIGPISIGSQVGYNFWGYLPALWQNYEMRLGSYKDMCKHALKVLSVPIWIDFILSIGLAIYLQLDFVAFLVFYLANLCFVLAMSAAGSLYFPIKVKGNFKTGKKASLWVSFGSMIGMIPLIGILYNPLFYIVGVLYVGISIFLVYISIKYYKDWKYKVNGMNQEVS